MSRSSSNCSITTFFLKRIIRAVFRNVTSTTRLVLKRIIRPVFRSITSNTRLVLETIIYKPTLFRWFLGSSFSIIKLLLSNLIYRHHTTTVTTFQVKQHLRTCLIVLEMTRMDNLILSMLLLSFFVEIKLLPDNSFII